MRDQSELEDLLHRIDGKGYKAYKEIGGSWDLPGLVMHIDHVQGDPFAAPSRVRLELPPETAGFPPHALSLPARSWGVAALLARRFDLRAKAASTRLGSGKSGTIKIEVPGQEVLVQTAVILHESGMVEARCAVGLPANGRRILGPQASRLLLHNVPLVVSESLLMEAYSAEEVKLHADTNEDAEALRTALVTRHLLCFVEDGAILPRASGIDQQPLTEGNVVAFRSPDSLRVSLDLPVAGTVTGMGIPQGVTLVVGGGYHGKSTLLRALERGVYNHRPGDGRERVATISEAVKIRAEDGRAVHNVDISPFISELPGGRATDRFDTENASGSTSQAAAISEAVEMGARLLLIDEDTAATNFMIRDRRMQALVPREREPITPFIDRVRGLYEQLGVSSILVIGGSGDYLDVADTVIAMDNYLPSEVTELAQEVARNHPTGRTSEAPTQLALPPARSPLAESLDLSAGRRRDVVKVHGPHRIQLGRTDLDLWGLEQLVSRAQTRALGRAILWVTKRVRGESRTLAELLDEIDALIAKGGLDRLDARRMGDMAIFRRFELGAALNRIRALEFEVHL